MEKTVKTPSPEVIEALKKEHGSDRLRLADLRRTEDGPVELTVVMRIPGRRVLGEFEKWVEKQPDKAKEILVNHCVLTDKDAVLADDMLFLSAVDAAAELIPKPKPTVRPL